MSWLYVAGIVIFLVGLMASIALHEIGHLVPAKLFKVKVTQYMVGFGPTLWSRRKGDTEYGVKWIPMGGYIRMVGALPPRAADEPGKVRRSSTGPFQNLIESAREVALEDVRPGDEDRLLYRKKWWQKVVIMAGGPAMNFVVAFVVFAVVLMGFGVQTAQPVVKTVSPCAVPVTETRACAAADPIAPAAKAGMRPGDRIVSFEGKPVSSWTEVSLAIRGHGPGPTVVEVVRDGRTVPIQVELIGQDRPSLTEEGKIDKNVGFLGITPTAEYVRQDLGAVTAAMWDMTVRGTLAIVNLPERMVGVWEAAFSGEKRDANGPIGIVGAGRIAGELAENSDSGLEIIISWLMLLAGFNLAIGLFNLIPLLPLDGGHIAGALWEGLRGGVAKMLGRPNPGYVDLAKALPLTYAMALILVTMAGLLFYADLVNPVRLFG
ncbi:M50 family metallopeptidase [Rhizohabitans arisaemae]|uniref:M50 family metallopeptidase n=1 Tax=Rhizohabitans arisaemae TaxID=2720610 RepID=UPI0024B0FDD6|nr:site-2 protease family protein [Rhizohabitans arisaemae]